MWKWSYVLLVNKGIFFVRKKTVLSPCENEKVISVEMDVLARCIHLRAKRYFSVKKCSYRMQMNVLSGYKQMFTLDVNKCSFSVKIITFFLGVSKHFCSVYINVSPHIRHQQQFERREKTLRITYTHIYIYTCPQLLSLFSSYTFSSFPNHCAPGRSPSSLAELVPSPSRSSTR